MLKPMVLVVEGDRKEAENLIDILKDDYEPIVAFNGQDALSVFENVYMKVRMVLLCATLPDIEGLKVLKSMRNISLLPEIIVYSDEENIQIAIEAMKKGAYDYMIKPFKKQELLNALEKTLENIDHIKKIEEFSKNEFAAQFDLDRRLAMSQDILLKKRLDGESVSAEQILELFPLGNHRKDMPVTQIKTEIERHIKANGGPLAKPKILVVEDEDDYRLLLGAFLKEKYLVIEAGDGETALQLMKKHNDIELVLLDIFLPDVSGTELVPQFKEINSDCEIIILTAFELIDVAVKTLRDGAYDFINKPVLKEDLLKTIDTALHRKFLRSVLPKIGKKLLEEKLSYKSKVSILNELLVSRKTQGSKVSMEDIYTFFPELRQTFIPEGLTIPEKVLDQGFGNFIDDLRSRLKYFNPTTKEV